MAESWRSPSSRSARSRRSASSSSRACSSASRFSLALVSSLEAAARFSSASRAATLRSSMISRSAVARTVAISRSAVARCSATSWSVAVRSWRGLALGLGAHDLDLAPAVVAQLVGLALGAVAGGLGLALGGGLHRGGDGPGLLDHFLRLEVGGGDQLLGLALRLAPVLLGLLLGQAEQLLDAGAEARQRGLGPLLELLGLLGHLAFEVGDAVAGIGGARLGLGGGVAELVDAAVQPLDEHVDLRALIAPEHDREVRSAAVGRRRRSGCTHRSPTMSDRWPSAGPDPGRSRDVVTVIRRRRHGG